MTKENTRVYEGIRQHSGDRLSLSQLVPHGSVGIELGVAKGDFSKHMVESGRFRWFYGVDVYGDHHDTAQYVHAVRNVGLKSSYTLFRMRFDEALGLFEDESLDFVYIDGYAHTGEDMGQAIFTWLKKVKVGGIISGHDYHPEWPRVVEAVNELARATGFELVLTTLSESKESQDRYPSWVMMKTSAVPPLPPPDLTERLMLIEGRTSRRRQDPLDQPLSKRVRFAIALLLGPKIVRAIQKWR